MAFGAGEYFLLLYKSIKENAAASYNEQWHTGIAHGWWTMFDLAIIFWRKIAMRLIYEKQRKKEEIRKQIPFYPWIHKYEVTHHNNRLQSNQQYCTDVRNKSISYQTVPECHVLCVCVCVPSVWMRSKEWLESKRLESIIPIWNIRIRCTRCTMNYYDTLNINRTCLLLE